MDKLFCFVWLIVGVIVLESVVIHGDFCDCNVIREAVSKEIFDLKIDNIRLTSRMETRMETIESMLLKKEAVASSLTHKDTDQNSLEEKASLVDSEETDKFTTKQLLVKALRSEKLERLRLERKIEDGLDRMNSSFKEIDEHVKGNLESHVNNISRNMEEFKKQSSEINTKFRNDIMNITKRLESQTNELVTNRTAVEIAIEGINQDVSRLDSDISSVVDIILLDKKALCEPNCTNGGVCFNDGNCRCKPLTEGSQCEKFICEDKCFENEGECVGPGLCKCPPGFHGYSCEYNIDECSSQPCLGGSCTDWINGYSCTCFDGYSGLNCETDIDECSSQPCVGGSCTDRINGYSCTCFDGYIGLNCEIDIDDCSSQPCVGGSCTDRINGYSCTCFDGYTGLNCEIDSCGVSVAKDNIKVTCGWSANTVLGCPDVYPKYGDYRGSWAQGSTKTTEIQYIEVNFDEEVNVTGIDIYETYHAGGVTAISGLYEGHWRTLWKADRPEVIRYSRIFSPSLDLKDSFSSTKNIRIEVDCREADSWVEIDAIRLYGCAYRK